MADRGSPRRNESAIGKLVREVGSQGVVRKSTCKQVRAVAAGAEVVVAVGEAYGWRLGRVVDPFGHHWEIGHPLAP